PPDHRADRSFPTRRSSDLAPRGFAPGDHGSTFGGNPVSCAAAVAVCQTIDDDVLSNVRENGARLLSGLAALPAVTVARGAGLLRSEEHTSELQSPYDLVCR